MRLSSAFAFQFLLAVLVTPPQSAVAREKPRSLADRASCHYEYDFGLRWGLCHVPELKVTVLAIEEKQQLLTRALDRRTADALRVDWKRFIDRLASEVGSKWFDSVRDDVAADLNSYRQFLEAIDAHPLDGISGHWENSLARVSITKVASSELDVEVDALSCMVPAYSSGAIRLAREGAGLRLALDRTAYEAAFPSAFGCFPEEQGGSVIDGLYLAVKPSPEGGGQ